MFEIFCKRMEEKYGNAVKVTEAYFTYKNTIIYRDGAVGGIILPTTTNDILDVANASLKEATDPDELVEFGSLVTLLIIKTVDVYSDSIN
jgi:hypothetical protein